MADTTQTQTEPKRKYKLLTGMHRTGGVVYRSGDPDRNVLELTKSQAEALGERVEPVSPKKSDSETDSIPNPNTEKPTPAAVQTSRAKS